MANPPLKNKKKPPKGDPKKPAKQTVKKAAGVPAKSKPQYVPYKILPGNWDKNSPYYFHFLIDGKYTLMALPLSPSNLNITTHFATNLIPTFFGTVEEHSDVRYHDIQIEGTTGFAPRNPVSSVSDSGKWIESYGRSAFAVSGDITQAAGGFFAKGLGALQAAKNKALDLVKLGPKAKSGIDIDKTGYAAFHRFYQLLLQHKKSASKSSKNGSGSAPLVFNNGKDNTRYNVVVRSFSMKRSADNPMLYFYSISMRGYDLTDIADKPVSDTFDRLQSLGLSGLKGSSALANVKKVSNGVKGVLGSLVGGVNTLGR